MFQTLSRLAVSTLLLALIGSAFAQQGSGDQILARINGEVITERELDQLVAQQMQGQAEIPPAQRQQFLEEIINLMLLAQAGEKADLDDDPTLKAQITNHRRTALAQAFVRDLTVNEPVEESALRARYEEEFSTPPLEYRARHILVAELDQAEGLINRLNEGEDFEDLAQQFSEDGSAEQGGDLGWFARGDMVMPFADAVAALEVGGLTQTPVETRFGWHVIQLDDTRETEAPSFEQVASELRMRIVNERIENRLKRLRNRANIDYIANWAKP